MYTGPDDVIVEAIFYDVAAVPKEDGSAVDDLSGASVRAVAVADGFFAALEPKTPPSTTPRITKSVTKASIT